MEETPCQKPRLIAAVKRYAFSWMRRFCKNLSTVVKQITLNVLGDQSRAEYQRTCALREHQVYRLMRSMVSQLNGRLKGRRERFKLVDEGDGLIVEYSIWGI